MSVLRLALLIVLAGVITGYLLTRLEGSGPVISTRPGPLYAGETFTHEFVVGDEDAGVETMQVWLDVDGKRFDLLDESYDGNFLTGASLNSERRIKVIIQPKELGIQDGKYQLVLEARDYSWRGNRSRSVIPLVVDTKPPRISSLTGLTYVRRGGSEMVVYTVSDDVTRHGVELGELFFPGHPHPTEPQQMIALYALPAQDQDETPARIAAVDRAGNRMASDLPIEILARPFPKDTIELSEGFMQRKVAEISGETEGDLLAAYLKINGEMRRENAEQIRKICQKSSEEPLWRGFFQQLPNSQVGSRFAEQRTYRYQGREVDQQVHMGYDLASTAHADIPAANDGIVIFADSLGIYGNTVIIDHGLGLFTLYGHLSAFAVEKGEAVNAGQVLGSTGTTGLAGGDHLHFSVLVGGIFVDPLEWFDPRWIREHIEPKLRSAE